MKTPSVNQKCAWSLSTLAAVIGVAIATLTTSSLFAANTSNVNVVNTPNVNIANTPIVTLSGTPSVSITGTPNVNVANTPIVQDRDNPARQPFTYNAGDAWIGNAPNISFYFTVPGGKRLVIEQVSVSAHLTASTTQKLSAEVQIFNGSPFTFYRFVGTDAGQNDFVASSQVRCYADAGTSVALLVTRSDTSVGGVNFGEVSLSGYLIDTP